MTVAIDALYAAPLGEFVAVRKQLAADAKAAGDRTAAAAIAKLARPTPSAWAVNQLWRQASNLWALLDRASRAVGSGDLSAMGDQRAALAALRARAVELSQAAAQPASEAMLAKLDTNLRALAAHGWGAVTPGQLVEDLPPPGFDAMPSFTLAAPLPPPVAAPPPPLRIVPAIASDDDGEAERAAAAAAVEAAALARQAELARVERARRATVVAERKAAAAIAHARVVETAAVATLARAEADRAALAVADARARAEAADRDLAVAEAALASAPP